MAKLYGPVGFAETVLTSPGVWEEKIVEHMYYMEQNRVSRRLQNSGDLNDDVNITSEFSFISDPYADNNFSMIRYVKFMGVKWKITKVDVQSPRLILIAGGVYNG